MFGQRLKHARRAKGLTLADLGAKVGRTPSVLSLIENGKREPRLSLVEQLAAALGVPVTELLKKQPPSRRAQLEIALEQAQRDPSYKALGLPELRVGTRVPTDVLEHLVALASELRAQRAKPTATPEEARAANAALRGSQRERGNYFAELEQAAAAALDRAGYAGGALSQGMLLSVVATHGFSVRFASRPAALRPVADRPAREPDLREAGAGRRPLAAHRDPAGPRPFPARPRHAARLRRLPPPAGRGELLRRGDARSPSRPPSRSCSAAKNRRDLAVEDLVDVFSVSYEMAAHRVTNLITHHLDVPCHFVKNDASGVIYKAYQNDGVVFPADATGAIEGQRMCRQWSGRQVFAAADRYSPHYQYSDTPSGTYFCVAQVDPSAGDTGYAITLGVPFDHSRWFRGRESTIRTRSRCPDGDCCQRAPAALAERWEGMAWPSARAHSHVLSVLPSGAFPGVDDVDIYEFLDRHAAD